VCRGFARDRLTWIGIEGDGKAVSQSSRLGGALAAFISLRGLGWSTGCRPHHLPDPLPRDYGPFLSALVGRIVWFQAICVANMWLVATSERSRDGTLRPLLAQLGYPDAPMWLCHLLIGLGIGQAAWSGLELGNACVTLIAFVGTVVLRTLLPASLAPAPFVTRMWPPLMRPPHLATSVGRFWTKCWHALFATPFRFIAYDSSLRVVERLSPGNRALGQLVGTLAVFTLSGLMHDYGIGAGVGPPTGGKLPPRPWRTFESTAWFLAQGVVIILERAFTRITGRRIDGPIGRIWTIGWMIGSGSILARFWLDHRLADGIADPSSWQAWRFVVPFAGLFPG